MPRVDREELAFDVGGEIVHPRQPLDGRRRADRPFAVDIPLGKRLDLDEERILVVLDRHNAVNRRIWKTDAVICLLLHIFREMFIYKVFEHGRPADHILTRDDIERRIVLCKSAYKSLGDIRRDEFEDVRADRRRHDICRDKRIEQFLKVRIAVDRPHMLDMDFFRRIADNLNVVSTARIDLIDECLRHIDERNLVARADEEFADEPTADIAAAEMNCLFHSQSSCMKTA